MHIHCHIIVITLLKVRDAYALLYYSNNTVEANTIRIEETNYANPKW